MLPSLHPSRYRNRLRKGNERILRTIEKTSKKRNKHVSRRKIRGKRTRTSKLKRSFEVKYWKSLTKSHDFNEIFEPGQRFQQKKLSKPRTKLKNETRSK